MASETTDYLYNGMSNNVTEEYGPQGQPLAEYDAVNGQVVSRKMFGFHGRKYPSYAGNIRTRGGLLYYNYDGQGNVLGVQDHIGDTIMQYRYDAFGNLFTGMPAPYNTTGYTGKTYDPAAGLMDYSARWYSPSYGRFITQDSYMGTMDNTQSLNRYAYVQNNPVNMTDPTGHVAAEGGGGTGGGLYPGKHFNVQIQDVGSSNTFNLSDVPSQAYDGKDFSIGPDQISQTGMSLVSYSDYTFGSHIPEHQYGDITHGNKLYVYNDQYYYRNYQGTYEEGWTYTKTDHLDKFLNGSPVGEIKSTQSTGTFYRYYDMSWSELISAKDIYSINQGILNQYGTMPSVDILDSLKTMNGLSGNYGLIYGGAGVGQNGLLQNQINSFVTPGPITYQPATGAYCHWGACHSTPQGMGMGAAPLSPEMKALIQSSLPMLNQAIHLGLDIVGFVPGIGWIADGANAALYVLQGDKRDAALSTLAIIPLIGDAATAERVAKDTIHVGNEAIEVERAASKPVNFHNPAAGDNVGVGLSNKSTNRSINQGDFSITNWDRYPSNGPKPNGPFRLLEGEEYQNARKAANNANAALHRKDPGLNGKQIHEIHPVKFGGSPTDNANKIPLSPKEHAEYTRYWNNLMRNIKK